MHPPRIASPPALLGHLLFVGLVIAGLLLHPHTLLCFAMVGMMAMAALLVWAGATIVRGT